MAEGGLPHGGSPGSRACAVEPEAEMAAVAAVVRRGRVSCGGSDTEEEELVGYEETLVCIDRLSLPVEEETFTTGHANMLGHPRCVTIDIQHDLAGFTIELSKTLLETGSVMELEPDSPLLPSGDSVLYQIGQESFLQDINFKLCFRVTAQVDAENNKEDSCFLWLAVDWPEHQTTPLYHVGYSNVDSSPSKTFSSEISTGQNTLHVTSNMDQPTPETVIVSVELG